VAVRSEPAELEPGAEVTYQALVVGPGALESSEALEWAFCSTPKPLGENASVAPACLDGAARPVGIGASLTTTLPGDACALFGSEVTSADIRPRDPDSTGGYYQPVRVLLGGPKGPNMTVWLTRIRCDLRNAPLDVVRLWTERYRPNKNPSIVSISALARGEPADFARLPARAELELRVELAASSRESYVVFDPASQSLDDAEEALQVSWLVTAGELDVPRSTAEGDPPVARARFRVPGSGGPFELHAVARDGRGGVAFVSQALVID
jgi:hypothetical protein